MIWVLYVIGVWLVLAAIKHVKPSRHPRSIHAHKGPAR